MPHGVDSNKYLVVPKRNSHVVDSKDRNQVKARAKVVVNPRPVLVAGTGVEDGIHGGVHGKQARSPKGVALVCCAWKLENAMYTSYGKL